MSNENETTQNYKMSNENESNFERNNTSYPMFMFSHLKEDPDIGNRETGTKKILDKPGTLLFHQKTIIQYLLYAKNIRGILLWHEMGSGKTRIPVAMIKTIAMSGRKFVFIGPKGLHDNFRKEFSKVGYHIPDEKISFISLNASNMFDQVTRMETESIQFRMDLASEKDEKDYAKEERLRDVTEKQEGLPGHTALDDTFVFVDEAHKLFNAITNGSKNALNLYDLIVNAKNIKVVFGTGTAIVNTPFELAPCFNMLAGKKLFPEDREEFDELFIGEKTSKDPKTGEVKVIDRYIKNGNIFKNRMVGLVSYYGKWVQNPEKGEDRIKPEQLPMEIVKVPMSNDQFARYSLYHDKEKQEKSFAGKKSGRFAASKSVSSYRVKTRMVSIAIPIKDDELEKEAKEKKITLEKMIELNVKNPNNCPKYYKIKEYLEKIKKGIVMIYSDFVHGVGLERIGKFLEYVMGYERYSSELSNTQSKKNRYIVISGDITTDERTNMQNVVNSKDNTWGEIIKVILVGPAGALGLNFKGIQCVILANPSFNMAQTNQAIARAVRNYSHSHLPKAFQKVRVIMILATEPENKSEAPSSDKSTAKSSSSKNKSEAPSSDKSTAKGSSSKNKSEARTSSSQKSPNKKAIKSEQTTDEYLYDYGKRNQMLNLKATKYVIEAAFDCELHRQRLTDKKRAEKINCLLCTPTNTPLFHDDYNVDVSSKYDPCKPPEKKEIKAREIILGDKKYMYNKDPESGEYQFFEYREDLNGFILVKKDDPNWSNLYKTAENAKPLKAKKNTKGGFFC